MADDDRGTVIAEYSETAAALATLTEQYGGKVYEVDTTAGMKLALAARADLRSRYVELEKTREVIKRPHLRACREIDSQAHAIDAVLRGLHDPIDAQVKTEEAKKEAVRVEAARIAEVQAAERAAAEAAQAERDEERIRTATLVEAARDALAVLVELGAGETVVARALEAAIDRATAEPAIPRCDGLGADDPCALVAGHVGECLRDGRVTAEPVPAAPAKRARKGRAA